MTVASNTAIARRPLLVGALALLGITAAGMFVLRASALFGPHYSPTPYDDLLSKLADRESAVRMGGAIIAQQGKFNAHETALLLRQRMKGMTLADAVSSDLRQGHLLEVRGWILPQSLALLCALAARPA